MSPTPHTQLNPCEQKETQGFFFSLSLLPIIFFILNFFFTIQRMNWIGLERMRMNRLPLIHNDIFKKHQLKLAVLAVLSLKF